MILGRYHLYCTKSVYYNLIGYTFTYKYLQSRNHILFKNVDYRQDISKIEPFTYNCLDLGAKETWENRMVPGFLYFLSLHSVPNLFLSFVPYGYA